jgi:hypothetical protein
MYGCFRSKVSTFYAIIINGTVLDVFGSCTKLNGGNDAGGVSRKICEAIRIFVLCVRISK